MKVGLVGAGAWGTSLAHLLAAKGQDVKLWAFEPETADQINSDRENRTYLPGVKLDRRLWASSDLGQVVSGARVVVMVTPSHHLRAVAGRLAENLSPQALIVTASKGIEEQSLLT
ncbi:MAG: NAD(P)-binding domain-containing protein, partial [Deltaproteobacteria bacterium]|nr:NAD(P)-binding domain-containing protein [Deltaproteobacteria bacterium]